MLRLLNDFQSSLSIDYEVLQVKRKGEGDSWVEEERSFFVNQRIEKERPTFKRYSGEFNFEAELEGSEPDYLTSVLKDLYEKRTGSVLSRLRYLI